MIVIGVIIIGVIISRLVFLGGPGLGARRRSRFKDEIASSYSGMEE